jgi:hypothetical protein
LSKLFCRGGRRVAWTKRRICLDLQPRSPPSSCVQACVRGGAGFGERPLPWLRLPPNTHHLSTHAHPRRICHYLRQSDHSSRLWLHVLRSTADVALRSRSPKRSSAVTTLPLLRPLPKLSLGYKQARSIADCRTKRTRPPPKRRSSSSWLGPLSLPFV